MADLVAAAPGESVAIIDRGREMSYADLDAAGRRLAGGLAALDVGIDDRVALWLPNVPAWMGLCLGCARLGAIAVSVNTRYRHVEVADILGRSGARVLALWPGFKEIDFIAILEQIEPETLAAIEAVVVYDEGGDDDEDEGVTRRLEALFGDDVRIIAHDDLETTGKAFNGDAGAAAPCAIFTTSGTTKAPKFVVHTQHSLVDQGRIVANACDFHADDCVPLLALPYCGVFGFSLAMSAIAAGRPLVSMVAFDGAEAARLIDAHAVTHVYGSDDLFHRILEAAPDERPFPSLRLCGYAAFNAALTTLVEVGDARGVTFVGVYGSSELQALVTCQRGDAPAADRAQGGGYPTAAEDQFRVRNPEDGTLQPVGLSGELEAKTIGLFDHYFGDEAATREAMSEDGFFKTGDLAYIEDDGRVVFQSRMGDVLRLGGFLTAAAEIETHIEAHPAVDECKVVSVATTNGTRAVAFVIPEPDATVDEAELERHCIDGIAKYKVPMRYFKIDAFPVSVSPNGVKVRRTELRDMAEARLAAEQESADRPPSS